MTAMMNPATSLCDSSEPARVWWRLSCATPTAFPLTSLDATGVALGDRRGGWRHWQSLRRHLPANALGVGDWPGRYEISDELGPLTEHTPLHSRSSCHGRGLRRRLVAGVGALSGSIQRAGGCGEGRADVSRRRRLTAGSCRGCSPRSRCMSSGSPTPGCQPLG
jgi:hypothetical protein